jgi:hypothetical protein
MIILNKEISHHDVSACITAIVPIIVQATRIWDTSILHGTIEL